MANPMNTETLTLAPVVDFAGFLARLSPKVRATVDKHVEIRAADAARDFGRVWNRLAEHLCRLAPHAVEMSGAAIRFYILDGKYRRQVFVLDEDKEGKLYVYMPDVLAAAQTRGLLGKPEEGVYPVLRGSGAKLPFEEFCADSKEIPDFCKAMLGWGRRAVRTGPVSGEEKQLHAIERLCELASETWNLPVVAAAK
ncbi:MAG: hypothetical protein WCI73_13875 [Phycisphaerae bacterium]